MEGIRPTKSCSTEEKDFNDLNESDSPGNTQKINEYQRKIRELDIEKQEQKSEINELKFINSRLNKEINQLNETIDILKLEIANKSLIIEEKDATINDIQEEHDQSVAENQERQADIEHLRERVENIQVNTVPHLNQTKLNKHLVILLKDRADPTWIAERQIILERVGNEEHDDILNQSGTIKEETCRFYVIRAQERKAARRIRALMSEFPNGLVIYNEPHPCPMENMHAAQDAGLILKNQNHFNPVNEVSLTEITQAYLNVQNQ